jgi:hypothetical protein
VHVARERDFVCSFGSLKLLMKELMGGEFREDKYRDANGRPFAKFKDFVMEAERRGKVQVFTSGAMNEVFLPGEDPYKLSRFAMDLKEEPVAPARPLPVVVEERPEQRQTVGGRRRRRRSRGGRNQTAEQIAQNGDLFDGSEDLDDLDLSFAEGSDLPDSGDAMFDELLGRLDAEETRRDALDSFDALQLLDEPIDQELQDAELAELAELEAPAQAELPELVAILEVEPIDLSPAEEPAPIEAPAASEQVAEPSVAESTSDTGDSEAQLAGSLPFVEEEWTLLLNLMARTDRALSFVQIHDLLRDARNNAGINRTNEELRSLIKQAINSGKLVRSGKGTRVNYRLAPPTEPAPEPSEPAESSEPSLVELVTATEVVPAVVDAVAAPIADAPAEPSLVELVAEAPTAEPEAKPKRSRKKKVEAPAEIPAEPVQVVEPEPIPEPTPEPPPEAKPKRSRKKKTETPGESA